MEFNCLCAVKVQNPCLKTTHVSYISILRPLFLKTCYLAHHKKMIARIYVVSSSLLKYFFWLVFKVLVLQRVCATVEPLIKGHPKT